MRTALSQEEIRRQNLGALLRHVHLRGATSRAELTANLRLNRSTIGALTADLTLAGLVSETAPRTRTGAGRPSLVVRCESSRFHVYALSIDVDRIRAARVGLGGTILDRRQLPRERDQEVDQTIEPLVGLVRDMAAAAGEKSRNVGFGVAVCGMVRGQDGVVRLSPHTGWSDEPLGERIIAALATELPVTVRNVAELSAHAEHVRGAAIGAHNVIYLYSDVGVGAGIIAGGRRLAGHTGYGGEVGHMIVRPGGHLCGCGARGCWETEIGEQALLRAAGNAVSSGRDAVLAVVMAARSGDAVAQSAVRQVGDWLGFGTANLVNIFNPEVIVFGGTLRDIFLVAAASVRSRLTANGLAACREHLRLRTPELGDDAALIGAAELAFEGLLANPLATAATT